MSYLVFLAHLHAKFGGGKLGIFVLQLSLFVLLSALLYGLCRWLVPLGRRGWHVTYATAFAYGQTGFLLCALPLSNLTPATTWVGRVYLTTLWPVWTYGELLGFKVEDWTPTWLLLRMFN